MAPTTAAAPSSPEGSVRNSTHHSTLSAPGSAGKNHSKLPNKALAGQTGGGAGDAATRRLEVVERPPPRRRLTKAQRDQRARAAFLAYLEAAKVAADKRHQRYIQGKAAFLGVTVDEAEKKAQAENKASRLSAQKNWANSHIREPITSEHTVWTDKEQGWITKE